MLSEEEKFEAREDLSRKLDLITKRLDTLETIILGDPDCAELATPYGFSVIPILLCVRALLSDAKPQQLAYTQCCCFDP